MTGQMHLKGDQLMVADTPDFRVVASPDLLFAAGADGYDVTGEVLIPLARITPRDLSTTVSTSPDERIVGTRGRRRRPVDARAGAQPRSASCSATTSGSTASGLKARLDGAVTVMTRPDDVVRGDGVDPRRRGRVQGLRPVRDDHAAASCATT